jgi:predicted  nucleic acid-binding Zn-ribbon protein
LLLCGNDLTPLLSNLQQALDLKEAQYDELRTSSADKIDRMQQALDAANDEYSAKESEADALRDDLRAKRVSDLV